MRFLSAVCAANGASFSLLATCRFNFETDQKSVFFFFGRFFFAQLISCFSSTAMPVAVSVNFTADNKPFCRGPLLHVDEDATLLSVLLFALGVKIESLNFTLHILTPETRRSRRRPAPCLFSHHRRTRSSGAQFEEARDSGLELVADTWPIVHHTRSTWATLATTFFRQQHVSRLPVLLFPSLEK